MKLVEFLDDNIAVKEGFNMRLHPFKLDARLIECDVDILAVGDTRIFENANPAVATVNFVVHPFLLRPALAARYRDVPDIVSADVKPTPGDYGTDRGCGSLNTLLLGILKLLGQVNQPLLLRHALIEKKRKALMVNVGLLSLNKTNAPCNLGAGYKGACRGDVVVPDIPSVEVAPFRSELPEQSRRQLFVRFGMTKDNRVHSSYGDDDDDDELTDTAVELLLELRLEVLELDELLCPELLDEELVSPATVELEDDDIVLRLLVELEELLFVVLDELLELFVELLELLPLVDELSGCANVSPNFRLRIGIAWTISA